MIQNNNIPDIPKVLSKVTLIIEELIHFESFYCINRGYLTLLL